MKVNIYGLPVDHRLLMAVGGVAASMVTIKATRALWAKLRLARKREERRNKRDKAISALKRTLETIKVGMHTFITNLTEIIPICIHCVISCHCPQYEYCIYFPIPLLQDIYFISLSLT